MKIKQLCFVSEVALATLVTAGAAQAALVVVPPGLNPGDQFRLVFVTDGIRDATSSNINDYNTFVTNQVTGSALATELTNAGFNLGTITWKAIGSTASVSAKVNTGTDGSQPDVPIYLIDGNPVANNNADLWDGSIIRPIDRTQNDTSDPFSFIWSGSSSNGEALMSNLLGDPLSVAGGFTSQSSNGWIDDQTAIDPVNLRSMYALSGVLTKPGGGGITVPEPSSLLGFITLGGLMLGGAVSKARK
ncbi:MAG: PEP-CTERM sorting domain-containing protein [Microcystis wesenbergii Mw_MB_S_20031200_S109]|uniref:PEP-CTERM sorting domain-containing protein n=1 Tax=Microcystis wesenbergii Mw_MB_S_20031200_S109D TaxID=2486241 RepID=A0A552LZ01_9CHRO|nr:MAG: PEP-CTERM sorting domain-containing protein [Microcystis wesenbergii Mw_MB_S_20031200_S109]TRV25443.1 MAG: PEP-CTERM sorting domain-containing protein [Microcystis wesenbergii Mw_MB_S_20031200_S109D]